MTVPAVLDGRLLGYYPPEHAAHTERATRLELEMAVALAGVVGKDDGLLLGWYNDPRWQRHAQLSGRRDWAEQTSYALPVAEREDFMNVCALRWKEDA